MRLHLKIFIDISFDLVNTKNKQITKQVGGKPVYILVKKMKNEQDYID